MRTKGMFMENSYLNMEAERKRLHLLAKPSGYVSGLAMDNLAFQMRYSIKLLSQELADAGEPRVLQLVLSGEAEGDPRNWSLYADGVEVASGTGAFARGCFEDDAESFLGICRKAVRANAAPSFGERSCELLEAARRIAAVEAKAAVSANGR